MPPADPHAVEATGTATTSGFRITVTPEYPSISTDEVVPLHAHVNILFPEEAANLTRHSALDVVCILDNSGSMDGGKIENLKKAMEFIVGVLGEKDRIAVVTFNSSASTVQGLKRMSSGAKEASRTEINAIVAGGGTDILAGMQLGWSILEGRRTRNAASSVFLLTDGQDKSNLDQKRALAASIRAAGSSLFLFGFGADHDSEHMNAIANAGEGSFMYIETDDTVIDAFGGAIGTQMGAILRSVEIDLSAAQGVAIEAVQAGKYSSSVNADRAGGIVRFADLYGGEQRDFLVTLHIPASAERCHAYPVLAAKGRFRQQGSEAVHEVAEVVCTVDRLSADELLAITPRQRNVGVDCQLQRLQCMDALERALQAADRANLAEAKTRLERARQLLMESVAFQQSMPVAVELLRELDDALRSVASKEEYASRGGRSNIQESFSSYSAQRVGHAKKAGGNVYQNVSSASCQSSAVAYKSPAPKGI